MNTDYVFYGSPDGRERRRAIRRRVEDRAAAMPIVASVQVMDISRVGASFLTLSPEHDLLRRHLT
jgi:hypothetical protein